MRSRFTATLRKPSSKALLSSALANANHAVLLDGKGDYLGAIVAYNEACNSLYEAKTRSSIENDQRKLDEVVCILFKAVAIRLADNPEDSHLQSEGYGALQFSDT